MSAFAYRFVLRCEPKRLMLLYYKICALVGKTSRKITKILRSLGLGTYFWLTRYLGTDQKYELLKVWITEVTKVHIIPVVIGALGIVTKNVAKYLEKIDFKPGLDPLQKASLLGTARIVRKVLDYSK